MKGSATRTVPHPRAGRVGAAAQCPNCASPRFDIFHEVAGVPVHSCMLLNSAAEARAFPTGKIVLGLCRPCGFIFNAAYDPAMRGYAAGYEEQQSFSPRFNAFARQLAGDLIGRYELRNKKILEIGCGKGDFLALLCELGENEGIGIDPACDPQRVAGLAKGSLRWIQDYYSQKHGSLGADVVCCRHTLEHIPDTREFIRLVRRAVGNRPETLVFFEVPDVGRVLRETAFWDIYYEHCSYFTLGSLTRLFASNGFSVLRARKEFDDQYLLLDARPGFSSASARPLELDTEDTDREVDAFVKGYAKKIGWWKSYLREAIGAGKRMAIWGSSSKCVSFLTTLGIGNEIATVVDINPHRHGKFLPGTGHQIRPPEFLRDYRPDIVILMNPIYREEISRHLSQMGLAPGIESV